MAKEKVIYPLGDRVLVREEQNKKGEEKTTSGIIIPSTVSSEKMTNTKKGTVIAVGSGRMNEAGVRIPLEIKKGDTILFQWGDEVILEGITYHVVREDSVLAIIK